MFFLHCGNNSSNVIFFKAKFNCGLDSYNRYFKMGIFKIFQVICWDKFFHSFSKLPFSENQHLSFPVVFDVFSVLIADQSIGYKILHKFHHFRIIKVPKFVVCQCAKIKSVTINDFRIFFNNKFS